MEFVAHSKFKQYRYSFYSFTFYSHNDVCASLQPRQRPIVQYITGNNSTSVRYTWRLSSLLDHSHDNILHVTSADHVIHQGSNRAVTLVLTRQALLLVNMAEDSVERIFSLKELTSVDHITESTMLCLYCPPTVIQLSRPLSPAEHEVKFIKIRYKFL